LAGEAEALPRGFFLAEGVRAGVAPPGSSSKVGDDDGASRLRPGSSFSKGEGGGLMVEEGDLALDAVAALAAAEALRVVRRILGSSACRDESVFRFSRARGCACLQASASLSVRLALGVCVG
jgi:hypothetical protein